jgi:hypothetical protein
MHSSGVEFVVRNTNFKCIFPCAGSKFKKYAFPLTSAQKRPLGGCAMPTLSSNALQLATNNNATSSNGSNVDRDRILVVFFLLLLPLFTYFFELFCELDWQ